MFSAVNWTQQIHHRVCFYLSTSSFSVSLCLWAVLCVECDTLPPSLGSLSLSLSPAHFTTLPPSRLQTHTVWMCHLHTQRSISRLSPSVSNTQRRKAYQLQKCFPWHVRPHVCQHAHADVKQPGAGCWCPMTSPVPRGWCNQRTTGRVKEDKY